MEEKSVEKRFRTVGDGSGLSHSDKLYKEEVQLAFRNRGMPLEALRYPITPTGMHYLLIHYDIPYVNAADWRLDIGGLVSNPLSLTLEQILKRPAQSLAVTLECAGNGRALMTPRHIGQPWFLEAIGTAEWLGTPLKGLLEEAGLHQDVTEIIFSGLDKGVEGEQLQYYQRSLSLDEATRPEVLLAYKMNGESLQPQHGYPLRLLVPGWYGMASVKWLQRIEAVVEPFQGSQMKSYRYTPGNPVTLIKVRALLIPPGIPDCLTRTRLVQAGAVTLEGKAWAGRLSIRRVEVSVDGGASWSDAQLGETVSQFAWTAWSFPWIAHPGNHTLCVRATDSQGNVQPLDQQWNLGGYGNNMIQRVEVRVE